MFSLLFPSLLYRDVITHEFIFLVDPRSLTSYFNMCNSTHIKTIAKYNSSNEPDFTNLNTTNLASKQTI